MTQLSDQALKNIRAIVTTKWTNKGYRPITVRSIEGYYVDTALDNDADTWQVEIGDPDGDLMQMIQRDNEVRLQLFGFRPTGASFIVTGVADDLTYSEEGTWTITGRDLSSLAVDSTVPPQFYKHVRAHAIVKRQAAALGFKRHNLAFAKQVKKTQYVDGSESYWEFWYRLYRKEQKWIWTEPDGTLVANSLRYTGNPSYYFGTPKRNDPANLKKLYLPIEHAEWTKSMQSRISDVWVFGHRGDNGFLTKAHDPTTKGWIKRPRKIMLDQDAHTPKSAQRLAWEEIFEGKVGENELKLTIVDPGFEIHQNRLAVVRIPEKGYANTMYVVGVRQQGGPDGLVVEVRLRERNYAISRRVPQDPKLDTQQPTAKTATSLGAYLSGTWPSEWSNYFIAAANRFHGPWNFDLFLATLIAIADQETGGKFNNVRRNGGPGGSQIDWYPWRGVVSDQNSSPQRPPGEHDAQGKTLEEWHTVFANEKGAYVSENYAVGPMQLLSIGYKHFADDLLRANYHDQWWGGRWHPQHNIMAGGFVLRDKLKLAVSDSGRDIDMWAGVADYGEGASYAQSVKSKVYGQYLTQVQDAHKQAQDAAAAARDDQTDPVDPTGNYTGPAGLPSAAEARAFYLNYHPLIATSLQKREAIVAAAMWGYYNRDAIHYSQSGMRMKDFGPPPNVPNNTDCSGFATWCYKAAGARDPNGRGFDGTGYTGTLWGHGTAIPRAQLQPGDLVFYRNPLSVNSHVAVYVGNGKVSSHGQEAGPLLEDITDPGQPSGYRTYVL